MFIVERYASLQSLSLTAEFIMITKHADHHLHVSVHMRQFLFMQTVRVTVKLLNAKTF